MAGALLRSGSLRDFHPLGAVGNPVYRAASQLRAAIRRQLGEETANLFALPKQNERGDVIDWYAPVEGNIVPWSAATPEERAEAKAALLGARELITGKSRALQADENGERQVFGKLLALTTDIPGDDHIYLVDGRPVITFWGFHPHGAPSGLDVISGLETGAAAATPVSAAGETAAAGAAAIPAAAALEDVDRGEPVVQEERRRRPWWWWLLALLLLLLLLWLLLFGLRRCGVDVPVLSTLPPALFGEEARVDQPVVPLDRPAGTVLDDRGTVIERGGTVIDRDTGAVVGTDRTLTSKGDARGQTQGDAALTPEQQPGGAPSPGEQPAGEQPSDQTGQPPPSPEDQRRDAAAEKPAEGPAPAADPQKQEAEKPGQPPQLPPGAEGAQQRPPQPAPGAGRDAGAPLTIPPQAVKEGSTNFLNGKWRSLTGLQDTQGNPIDMSYDLKEGQGTVTLQRTVGNRQMTCTGQAGSAMQGGKLVINQGEVRCPDGVTFGKSNVECAPGAGGKAECRGVNADQSTYDVRIVK